MIDWHLVNNPGEKAIVLWVAGQIVRILGNMGLLFGQPQLMILSRKRSCIT